MTWMVFFVHIDELFQCQQTLCANSCCGAYNGFSDRLFSVDGRKFKDIVLTPEDTQRLLSTCYCQYVFVAEDGLGRMKTDDAGVCSAWKNGKCLVHDFKPTVCRCYPLCLDVLIGLCAYNDCPSAKKEYNIINYSNQIESLVKMYEFWISYYKGIISRK